MFQDYSPANPYRVPHWRWDRAGLAAAGTLPLSRRRDDAWVGRACRFRKAMAACRGPGDYLVLAERDPALYWAYKAWSGKDDEERRITPHAIEARLLSSQDFAQTAGRAATTAAVVEAYAACYFDVLSRLGATDWIVAHVLGPAYCRGVRSRHYDLLWKAVGWQMGEHAVEAMILQMVDPTRPPTRSDVAGGFRAMARGHVIRQGMIAAQTIQVSDFTAAAIIEMSLKAEELERQGEGANGPANVLANVGAVLACLPFQVGRTSTATAHVAGLDHYDRQAAELRGDELTLLSVGVPPRGGARIEHLAFPEPPPREALAFGVAEPAHP